jgi:hypothetical protein
MKRKWGTEILFRQEKGFSDSLETEEDRNLFKKMLNECYKYSVAMNAKGRPFPTGMIDWLISQNTNKFYCPQSI